MKKEYIILFIILSILSIPNIVSLCEMYPDLNYDNQIFLAWQYAATIGQQPYRDIFFPYGYLPFYKGINWIFSALLLLLPPVLFTMLYYFFKKLFNEKLYVYISLFSFVLFIALYMGYEYFARYGTLVVLAWLYANALFTVTKQKNKTFLGLGMATGCALVLYNDVGIYACVTYVSLAVINYLLNFKTIVNRKAILIKHMLFLSGFVTALIPFLIYLSLNNALFPFFASVWELRDLTLFTKTPFFHAFTSADNLFTFSMLVLTIFSISYNIFYKKSKLIILRYIQIALVITLLILEQKNVIRDIDIQLTFIGFLMFIVLFADMRPTLEKSNLIKKNILIYYINLIAIIIFVLGLHAFEPVKFLKPCNAADTNSSLQYASDLEDYQSVKDDFVKQFGKNSKIFSYPGDTIFYVLFNQPMPYYPTIYEASNINAQKKQIEYIEKNKIQYILYNFSNTAIQDEVPNYVRASTLHPYILQNYEIVNKKNNYFYLRKTKTQKDFLKDTKLDQVEEFKKYLFHVELGSIPRSEGHYKSKELKQNQNKITVKSVKELNDFLAKSTVTSDKTYIVIDYQNGSKKQKTTLTIATKDDLVTTVTFDQCQQSKPCIIHLSRLPAFYENRQIDSLSVDKSTDIKQIRLIQINNNDSLW